MGRNTPEICLARMGWGRLAVGQGLVTWEVVVAYVEVNALLLWFLATPAATWRA